MLPRLDIFGFLFGVIATCAVFSSTSAAIVYRIGSSQPEAGYLVSQTETSITLRRRNPDGTFQVVTYQRSELDEVILTVSSDRLESLQPEHPEAYRDYAEELAEKRIDPEARDMAIRLYLIAAFLDEGQVRKSALLGLIAVARNQQEEARLRMLAFQVDRSHDPDFLNPSQAKAPVDQGNAASRQQLKRAIQQLRRGRKTAASDLASQPDVKRQFEGLHAFTYQEFQRACFTEEISPAFLRRLIQWELSQSGRPLASENESAHARQSTWSQIVQRNAISPIKPVSFDSVTEFDPRQCVFDQGEWRTR